MRSNMGLCCVKIVTRNNNFQPLFLAFSRGVLIQSGTPTHERHRQIPLLTTTSNQEQKGQFTSLLEANDKCKQRIPMVIA